MEIGDRFAYTIEREDGSTEEIEYEVCTLMDLMSFIGRGGDLAPFDDVRRRVFGFARGAEGRAVTLMEFKENSDLLSPRIRDDLVTPQGREKIAERFSG